MSLSSILKTFKSGIDKVGAKVESATRKAVDTAVLVWQDVKRGTFIENVKGWFKDSVKDSLTAMETWADRWIPGNIQTQLTKWLYWLGEVVTWAWVPFVWEKTDAGAIQRGAQKLSETISLAPTTKLTGEVLGKDSKVQKWLEWVKWVTDIYSNVLGRAGSATDKFQKWDYVWGTIDTWFSLLGAIPFTSGVGGLAAISWISWGLGAAGANEYIAEQEQAGKDTLYTKFKEFGMNDEDAFRRANNVVDSISLITSGISMYYGMKVGGKWAVWTQLGKLPKNVTVADVIKTNAINATKSGIADTLPAVVYDIIDKSDKDPESKQMATTLLANTLAGAYYTPTWKGKKWAIDVDTTKATTPEIPAKKPLSQMLQDEGTTRITDKKNGIVDYTVVDGTMKIDNIMSNESGAGQGTKLLKKAETAAKKQWANRIELVATTLDPARTTPEQLDAFYTKNGYARIEGTERGYEKVLPAKKEKPLSTLLTEPETTPKTPVEGGADFIEDTKSQYTRDPVVEGRINEAKRVSMGDYTPEFDAWAITKAIPTLSAMLSRNFNLNRFLDNIRIKVGDAWTPVGKYVEGVQRSMKSNIQESIVEPFAGSVVKRWLKVKLDPKDLLGTQTTQWISVTEGNLPMFQKWFSNMDYYDKKFPWLTQAETNQIVQGSYIYDLVKQNGLDGKYFTPEQIAFYKNLEAIEKDLYGKTSLKAQDDWVYNGALNEDYLHFDMVRKNFENLPKEDRGSVVVRIDGKDAKFDSYLDALSAVDLAKRMGKSVDADAFISLEQKKSSNVIDPFRTHGAFGRILSYADAMWKAYADTQVVKLFDDMRGVGKDNSAVADHFAWLESRGIKNPVEQLLGYSDNDIFTRWVQWLSSLGSQAAITLNPATYAQGILSSGIKNFTDALGSSAQNLLSGEVKAAGRDLGDSITWLAKSVANTALALGKKEIGQMTRDQKITDALVRDGFITWLEIGDRAMGNAFEISSGLVQENAAKADVAIRGMRRYLLANGHKVGNGESIAKAWDDFRKTETNEYIKAREQILQDTKLIADVSRGSRLTTVWLYNTAGALKSYALGQISQAAQDSSTIFNYMTQVLQKNKLVNNTEVVNSMRRLAIVYGSFKSAQFVADQMMEGLGYVYDENNEDAKEMYKKVRDTFAQRISGTPEAMLSNLMGSVVSNVGLSKAYWLFNDLGQWLTEFGMSNNDSKYSELGTDVLDATRKFFAAGNMLNEAYALFTPQNETWIDTIAEELWVPGKSGMSRYGISSGAKTDSKIERMLWFFGFKPDQAVNQYLYGKLDEIQLEEEQPNPTLRTVALWLKNTWNAIARSEFPIVSDVAAKLSWQEVGVDWKWGIENRLKAQYTFDATDRLLSNPDLTLNGYLELNWINPQWAPMINQALNSRIKTIIGTDPKMTKNNELSPWSGNQQVEWLINQAFDPELWAKWDKSVVQNWIAMKDINEKLFNDTMAYIGKVAMDEDMRKENGVTLDLNKLQKNIDGSLQPLDTEANLAFDKAVKTISDSTSQDDAVIADKTGKSPLTTSFTNSYRDAIGNFWKYIQTEWIDGAKKRLDQVEKMTQVVLATAPFTNNFIDALSLANFDMKSWLMDMAKIGLKAEEIKARYPSLYDTLIQALDLRGEYVPKDWLDNQQNLSTIPTWTQTTQPTSRKLSESLGLLTPVTAIEWWVIPEKQSKPAQLKDKFIRVEWQPQIVQSLSELLKSK